MDKNKIILAIFVLLFLILWVMTYSCIRLKNIDKHVSVLDNVESTCFID